MIIETNTQYELLLTEAEALVAKDPEPGTPDAERLIELADALEAYEKLHP